MQATLALRFGGEGILKMKGIPFKASASDVRKFFAGYKIKSEGISFIMHADGRPTGMAFIEFETPQEAVRAMEKDRAKFGPEYGDRFCMLQLVGRHEMDKVTLQKENDAAANAKLLLGANAVSVRARGRAGGAGGRREGVVGTLRTFGPNTLQPCGAWSGLWKHAAWLTHRPPCRPRRAQGSLNVLQAAAMATQAALNNPALQPILMAGGNPWLNPLHLGLVNPASAAALGQLGLQQVAGQGQGNPMLDAQLAAQLSSQLNAGHGALLGGAALNSLGLLQQQQAAAAAAAAGLPPPGLVAQGNGHDAGGWVDPTSASAPLLFYHNQAVNQDWVRAADAR